MSVEITAMQISDRNSETKISFENQNQNQDLDNSDIELSSELIIPRTKEFLKSMCFDLSKKINEYQHFKNGNWVTPFLCVVLESYQHDNGDIIKNLLELRADINLPAENRCPKVKKYDDNIPENHNDVIPESERELFEISPFMAAMLNKNGVFMDMLLNDPSLSIDFNYIIRNFHLKYYCSGFHNEKFIPYTFETGDCLMLAMSIAFSGQSDVRCAEAIRKLIDLPNIDFAKSRIDITPFYYLCSCLQFIWEGNENLDDEYFALFKKCIDQGTDLNYKTEKYQSPPISQLFKFNEFFTGGDDGYKFYKKPRDEPTIYADFFLSLLHLFLKQTQEVELNIHCNYQDNHGDIYQGTPLMIAIFLRQFEEGSEKIINLLCSEIRVQTLRRIWNVTTTWNYKNSPNEDDLKTLSENVTNFVNSHSYLYLGADYPRMETSHKMLHDKTISKLREVVLPFVLSVIPKCYTSDKCLDDLIFSKKIKEKITTAGFNLKEGIFQHVVEGDKKPSLLSYAAKNGLKGLILCLAIQPSFKKYYKINEIAESLIWAVGYDKRDCVDILFSIYTKEVNSNEQNIITILRFGIKMAVRYERTELIQYFCKKYYQFIRDKTRFPLLKPLDPKVENEMSVLAETCTIIDCPYLLQEFTRMLLNDQGLFNLEIKLEDYLTKFVKRYLPTEDSEDEFNYIKENVLNPIIELFKYYGKIMVRNRMFLKVGDKKNQLPNQIIVYILESYLIPKKVEFVKFIASMPHNDEKWLRKLLYITATSVSKWIENEEHPMSNRPSKELRFTKSPIKSNSEVSSQLQITKMNISNS